jgi:mitochondrial fission protein ELM1
MATIHTYLMNQFDIMDDPLYSIIYGPSTSNKIERWWRDLHERLERYFKEQSNTLLKGMEYDPHNLTQLCSVNVKFL